LKSKKLAGPQTTINTPNADTLYCVVWFDLRNEPMVLRLPATTDRFFVLQFFDFDTNVIGSSSTRTRPDQGQTGFDISVSTHPIKTPRLYG
jgi:hypothetical protein